VLRLLRRFVPTRFPAVAALAVAPDGGVDGRGRIVLGGHEETDVTFGEGAYQPVGLLARLHG
jgi:hypothetical protein